MTRALHGWLVVAGLALAAVPRGDAQACSPIPPPPTYFSFTSTVPADGAANVPFDTAVALDLERAGSTTGQPRQLEITVTKVDGGAAVAGSHQVYAWNRLFAGWRPATPLEPRTRYRVQASVRGDATRPAGAQGVDQLSFTFTTGDQRSAPITLAGKLSVSLESYERTDYSKCQPGLCVCMPTDKERGVRARLSLPAPSGGHPERDYWAAVTVTEGQPYQFPTNPSASTQHVFGSAGVVLRPGQTAEALAESIDGEKAYAPCFTLRVIDLAGNEKIGDPVCLTTTVAPAEEVGAGGCQVSPGAASAGSATWVLVLLMGLALRTLRRRARAD